MNPLRIGISTQTPLLRFVTEPPALAVASGARAPSSALLVENEDYEVTPGGVCRMVLPTLEHWNRSGLLQEAHWFSLQTRGPRRLEWEGLPLTLHRLSLPAEELAAYARTKEKLWSDIHGIETPRFNTDDFRFYTRYNWFTADAILAATSELDVAYIHDFQLMQVGALVGLAAPSVLRWHVPFDPSRIPRYTRNFLLRTMEDFDAVIVSTRRDLEGLVRVGYRGIARQLYPHVNPSDWPRVSGSRLQASNDRWGFKDDDRVIIHVARMDPMKRQDVAIRALARVRQRHPRAKLVLVGNGSFSGSKDGGLSLSKSRAWLEELQALAARLGVADSVIFTHYVTNPELAALYERSDVAVLTSDIEGFGLTILESWLYSKPCVVSRSAGVSELVHDGVNGLLFRTGDDLALAEQVSILLSDAESSARLGESGRLMARAHSAYDAARLEHEVLMEALHRFGDS